MSRATLADFAGTFTAETADWDHPLEGRVLLAENQLVLAATRDDTVTIPLPSVFDISFDSRPDIFDPVPGTPLTIAYEHEGQRSVAVVGCEEPTAHKFYTVLFKTVLNGTGVVVKHPARRGGRVTNMPFQSGELSIAEGGVEFSTDSVAVRIAPSAVTAFDRETREISGTERPVFVVRYMHDGTAVTTLAATESPRTLSLLGRYLRRYYDELLASLAGLSLSGREVEALVTIYSADGDLGALTSVLDASPSQVKRSMQSLAQRSLVRPTGDGPELTTRGQVVVNHYLERVNE